MAEIDGSSGSILCESAAVDWLCVALPLVHSALNWWWMDGFDFYCERVWERFGGQSAVI